MSLQNILNRSITSPNQIPWANVDFNSVDTNSISSTVPLSFNLLQCNTLQGNAIPTEVDVNASLIPSIDATYDLGSVAEKWSHVYADNFAVASASFDSIKGLSSQDLAVNLQSTGVLNIGPLSAPTQVSIHSDASVLIDASTASLTIADGLGSQVNYAPTAIISTGVLSVVGQTSLGLSSNAGDVSLTASAGALNLSPALASGVVANAQILSTVGGAQYSSQGDPSTGVSSQAGSLRMLVSGTNVTQFNAGDQLVSVPIYMNTVAVPAIANIGDTTSGFTPGTGSATVTVSGVDKLTVTPTQITASEKLVLPAGSAGAPSLTFSSDLTSGIYDGLPGIITSVSGVATLSVMSGQAFLAGDFLPDPSSTHNLGSAIEQWENIYLVNVPVVSSDARLKKEVDTLSSQLGLSFVNSLRPVSYKWKESLDEREHFGVIAQELQQSLEQRGYELGRSSLVQVSEQGKYGVSPDALIPCLIKAVQQLSAQVDLLQSQKS